MILLLTSDLLFQSRIGAAAREAGRTCVVDRSVAKLIERVSEPQSVQLVIIDLGLNAIDLANDVPALKSAFSQCKVLAYGPHVDVDRLSSAEEAGAEVMTRGQFERNLNSLLQQA